MDSRLSKEARSGANGVVTLHKAGSTKLRAVYELLGIRVEAEIPVLAE